MRRTSFATLAFFAAVLPAAAQDEPSVLPGQPHDWQMGLQEAMSPIEAQIHWFSNYTLAFIIPITIIVAGLLGWCIWRYRAKANPEPSRTSHNTTIEVVWTLAPVVVLLFLAVPSFQLLTNQYNPPREPEMTLRAVGYQWYWGYEYNPTDSPTGNTPIGGVATDGEAEGEQEGPVIDFVSYPLGEGDREGMNKTDRATYPHLLAVDNEAVVPVDTIIRIEATSADVIHSFALPSMGVKVDAIPGRINEYWMEASQTGIFYGQCSELCGSNHYNMPIAIRVVTKEQYQTWYTAAQEDLDQANEQLRVAIQEQSGDGIDVAER